MKTLNVKYHVLFWLFCYVHLNVPYIIAHWDVCNLYTFVFISIEMVPKVITFYIVLNWILPLIELHNKKFWILFALVYSGVVFLIANIWLFFTKHLPKLDSVLITSVSSFDEIVQTITEISVPLPFAFVFWYAGKIYQQKRGQRQIQEENHHLEQSIIDTQLNNLKNQINPDFLFRKLDYFYKQSLPHSPSLSKGISLLTDMMKYAIDDEGENGKVSLQKEVKHIQNFIEINQLRFDGRLQVNFDINGVVDSLQIMPLVLITFVENAFKYGELFDASNPLQITLKVEGNDLYFTTYNITRRGPKEESEGIGINNTQKRLSLGYAENYSLNIKQKPEFYEVALYLKLA
jgi:two-component system LytT family sensor kinase